MAQIPNHWPSSPIHACVQVLSRAAAGRDHSPSNGGHGEGIAVGRWSPAARPPQSGFSPTPKPRGQERCIVTKQYGPLTGCHFSRSTLSFQRRKAARPHKLASTWSRDSAVAPSVGRVRDSETGKQGQMSWDVASLGGWAVSCSTDKSQALAVAHSSKHRLWEADCAQLVVSSQGSGGA